MSGTPEEEARYLVKSAASELSSALYRLECVNGILTEVTGLGELPERLRRLAAQTCRLMWELEGKVESSRSKLALAEKGEEVAP